MAICDTCGVELPMPGAFCSACGAPLPRSISSRPPVESAAAAPNPTAPAPTALMEPPAMPAAPWTPPEAEPPAAPTQPTETATGGSAWERATTNPMAPNPAGGIAAAPAASVAPPGVPGGPRPLSFPMGAPGAPGVPAQAAPTLPPAQMKVVSKSSGLAGKIVGAVGAIGVILGSMFEWAGNSSSFRVPALFVFDLHTSSRNPKLGFIILGVGIVGVIVSFVTRRGLWRVLLGAAAIVLSLAFCVQMQRLMSGSHTSLTDVLGGGVWLTAISGAVLAASPLLDRAHFG